MDQEIKKEFEDLADIIREGFDQTATKEELGRVVEKMATKEDLKNFATKEDLREMESRFELRFDSIESRLERIESDLGDIRQKLEALSERTKEDDDSVVKDIFTLRKRVDELEIQIKHLKLGQD